MGVLRVRTSLTIYSTLQSQLISKNFETTPGRKKLCKSNLSALIDFSLVWITWKNRKENKVLIYNLNIWHKEEKDASLPFKTAPTTASEQCLDRQLTRISAALLIPGSYASRGEAQSSRSARGVTPRVSQRPKPSCGCSHFPQREMRMLWNPAVPSWVLALASSMKSGENSREVIRQWMKDWLNLTVKQALTLIVGFQ